MPEFVLKLHSAFASMPPYTPMPIPLSPPILPAQCPYAPSVEHKLTGRLASGVQSGALVGKIMLSLPSNYHLDTLLHSFLSVLVAKADQLMRQKLLNPSPGSFNNGSSSYYLWPPWDLFLPQLVDSFRSKFGFLLPTFLWPRLLVLRLCCAVVG